MHGSISPLQQFRVVLAGAVALAGAAFVLPTWSQDTTGKLPPPALASSQPRPVLLVANLYPEHSFWSEHLRFSQAAARDLQFILEPVFLRQSQAAYRRLLTDTVKEKSYAGAVLSNMKNQGSFIIGQVRELGMPTVSNVVPMDFDTVGRPDPETPWIAELRPNEEENGATLLRHLVRDARRRELMTDSDRVEVIAIAGSRTDSVGQARLRGFIAASRDDASVNVEQVFYSEHWSREQSQRIMATALRRYPNARVIWSANDDIAIGAVAAIRDAGHDPALEFAVGGIDATPEMLDLIRRGDATVTIAGLSLHGAWSLVLLYHHLNGGPIATAHGATLVGSEVVDHSNVERYISLFRADADALNFLDVAAAVARGGPASALSLETLFAQQASMAEPE